MERVIMLSQKHFILIKFIIIRPYKVTIRTPNCSHSNLSVITMTILPLLVCVFLFACSITEANPTSEIGDKFLKDEIVPDVINEVPISQLSIKYNGIEITPGRTLTVKQTEIEPEISWSGDPTKKYTLLMLDPDVPGRQVHGYRSVLHWMAINVPGNSIIDGTIKRIYLKPKPAIGTGLHRYVFLVYEQLHKKDIEFDDDYHDLKNWTKFTLDKFIKRHGLALSEAPVGGNYFFAKYTNG